MSSREVEISRFLRHAYDDVLTGQALAAITHLTLLDTRRANLLARRQLRRDQRRHRGVRPDFAPPDALIPGRGFSVAEAREGAFDGGDIPPDLRCQWIQGTGPATRPHAPRANSLRQPAYALLSGADGWMFDGEDALGQVATTALDNHRNLMLAVRRDPEFLAVAEQVAYEMNEWATGFFGQPIIHHWRSQLNFTTTIYRPRGLHLDDRHLRHNDGRALSASMVDCALYVANNHAALRARGASVVLYLPKIETFEEAAFWNDMLAELEAALGLPANVIRVYVLIERVEACLQVMEIRAALSPRLVGLNTGRWDYINSVSDAMRADPAFVLPNIDSVTMTYPFMRAYEDRVRRAVNTPDRSGGCVLWQGGMEPQVPVGAWTAVNDGMRRAVAGAERERDAGASGKWVAHWKMVHIVRPVWEAQGIDNQLGRPFPPLTYSRADRDALFELGDAPRTWQGARALISVTLQYAHAAVGGLQAVALKPADELSDEARLYLMEDLATAEIRAGMLWEWLHKQAPLHGTDTKTSAGAPFSLARFSTLVEDECAKLDERFAEHFEPVSRTSTLPIARALLERFVTCPLRLPWFAELLNAALDSGDLEQACRRVDAVIERHLLSTVDSTDALEEPVAPAATVQELNRP